MPQETTEPAREFNGIRLTAQGAVDRERIIHLRATLTMWALGREGEALTLTALSQHILELDQLLQQFDL